MAEQELRTFVYKWSVHRGPESALCLGPMNILEHCSGHQSSVSQGSGHLLAA